MNIVTPEYVKRSISLCQLERLLIPLQHPRLLLLSQSRAYCIWQGELIMVVFFFGRECRSDLQLPLSRVGINVDTTRFMPLCSSPLYRSLWLPPLRLHFLLFLSSKWSFLVFVLCFRGADGSDRKSLKWSLGEKVVPNCCVSSNSLCSSASVKVTSKSNQSVYSHAGLLGLHMCTCSCSFNESLGPCYLFWQLLFTVVFLGEGSAFLLRV